QRYREDFSTASHHAQIVGAERLVASDARQQIVAAHHTTFAVAQTHHRQKGLLNHLHQRNTQQTLGGRIQKHALHIFIEPEQTIVDRIGNALQKATALLHRRLRQFADRKSTRLNSSHVKISYAVFCLKKKTIAKESKPNILKAI